MKHLAAYLVILSGTFFLFSNCGEDEEEEGTYLRHDQAYKMEIPLSGSLQNPAFSPDGDAIVFTRFRNGYNEEPADLVVFNLENGTVHTLVMDGSANVNLPGSCWNAFSESIVFSSSRDPHDEIYTIDDNGNPGNEIKITERSSYMAYEPSFSPDGEWIVFESHPLDVEGQGVITKYKTDNSSAYVALTSASDDCRQPNWSPSGNYILFQKFQGGQWDIWKMKPDGSEQSKVTSGEGDKTDACFTSDGAYIIYSSDADLEYANIYRISVNGGTPVRLTNYDGYDGAPSISSDGSKLVFESYGGDPDDSDGTKIWMLEVDN
ncbi:MAG: PD40 domain-containing protein [Bacteroidales bacterium]|nr:PD40 domain-containing protein [Bacteroidales bacterium]